MTLDILVTHAFSLPHYFVTVTWHDVKLTRGKFFFSKNFNVVITPLTERT